MLEFNQSFVCRFPNLVRILQGYGMTESTGVLTEESPTNFKEGSVGRVALGNIVKVKYDCSHLF